MSFPSVVLKCERLNKVLKQNAKRLIAHAL